LKSSVSASGYTGSYKTSETFGESPIQPSQDYQIENGYLKVASTYYFKQNAKNKYQLGVIATRNNFNMKDTYLEFDENRWVTTLDSKGHSYYAQAFMSWKHHFSKKVNMVAGLHATYLDVNQNMSLDPRLGFSWKPTEYQKLGLAMGLHSKMEPMSIYHAQIESLDGSISQANMNLAFTKAMHVVASYDRFFENNLHLKGEIYYQYLYDVPVGLEPMEFFSMLNAMSGYVDFAMDNQGYGRNYGVDLTFERFFDNDYYFLISGSLYNSEYKNPTEVWRNGRFAGDYTLNALGGKDFRIAPKKPGKRTLTLSMRGSVLGGRRAYPVLEEESIKQETTVYDDSNPWGIKLDDIFILNFAATYRVDKAKVSHEFKLDIQNLTNNQAALGKYYDDGEEEIVEYYQLPLFPVLSYKIYF
jgi:hypothetical protein